MAGQLTGLHAKFTGDSKSFVNAARMSAFELNKLNAKTAEQKTKAAAAASSTDGLAKSMHKLRMETDNAYAGMNRFERASVLAKKAAEAGVISQEQLGAELQRLANHYGVAEAAGMSMGNQLKSARFHAANLTAQFNDIAVMLAAGQNPLMLAVQQGTQISQVMQAAGGTTKQMGALLIESFRAMISPATLVTLALIAGGAALTQWAMGAIFAGKETVKFDAVIGELGSALTSVKSIIDILKMSNEELSAEFGKMSTEARNVAIRMLELQQVAAERTLAESILESSNAFNAIGVSLTESITGGRAAFVELESLAGQFKLTHAEAKQLSEAFIQLRDATTFQERLAGLQNVKGTMQALGVSVKQLPKDVQDALLEAEKLTLESIRLKEALAEATDAAPKAGFLAGAIQDMDVLYQRALDIIRVKREIDAKSMNFGTPLTVPLNEAGLPVISSLLPPPPPAVANAVVNTGGGGGVNYESELEQLSKSLLSKEQLELDSYNRRQELLKTSLEKKLLTQEQYAGMMEQVESAHNFAMLKQQNDNVSATLGALGQLFQGSKQIGAAIALTNSYLAFTEVLKDPSFIGRPFARFAAAASALSSGLAAVRSIKSAQPGGSASGGISGSAGGSAGSGSAGGAQTSTNVSLQLVGGDMYSRDQVLQLINAINAATADGAQIMLR
jgi:hypothetical protein